MILAHHMEWLLFQVGKRPLAFKVYAVTQSYSGAEGPLVPLLMSELQCTPLGLPAMGQQHGEARQGVGYVNWGVRGPTSAGPT